MRRTPITTPPAMMPTLVLDLTTGVAEGAEELVGWEDAGVLEGFAEPRVEDTGDPERVSICYDPAFKGIKKVPGVVRYNVPAAPQRNRDLGFGSPIVLKMTWRLHSDIMLRKSV